jgi:hypothetical protein
MTKMSRDFIFVIKNFSCPVVENFIWIEPLLRGHLFYKATFSLSQRWPFNTCLTVYGHFILPLMFFGIASFCFISISSTLASRKVFFALSIKIKKWPYKTGDLLKEVQSIWNYLWQDKKRVTFKYRWLLNGGDRMGRFYCILPWTSRNSYSFL